MLEFLPYTLVIVIGLVVIEFLVMLYAFGGVISQFSNIPVVLDVFGNVDTFQSFIE